MTESQCSVADCDGARVYQSRCVGHMNADELADYAGRLGADDTLDASGASIDEQHCRALTRLLAAASFSGADFSQAKFTGDAKVHEAQFSLTISFRAAQFSDSADFGEAQFTGLTADFIDAQFSPVAFFGGAVHRHR